MHHVSGAFATASFTFADTLPSSGATQLPPKLTVPFRSRGVWRLMASRPGLAESLVRAEYIVAAGRVARCCTYSSKSPVTRTSLITILHAVPKRRVGPVDVDALRVVANGPPPPTGSAASVTRTRVGCAGSAAVPLRSTRVRRRQRVLRLLGLNRGSRDRARRGCSAAAARRGSSQENTAYGGHDEIERSSTSHDDHLPLIRRLAGAEEY